MEKMTEEQQKEFDRGYRDAIAKIREEIAARKNNNGQDHDQNHKKGINDLGGQGQDGQNRETANNEKNPNNANGKSGQNKKPTKKSVEDAVTKMYGPKPNDKSGDNKDNNQSGQNGQNGQNGQGGQGRGNKPNKNASHGNNTDGGSGVNYDYSADLADEEFNDYIENVLKKIRNEVGGPLSDFIDKCKRSAKLKDGLPIKVDKCAGWEKEVDYSDDVTDEEVSNYIKEGIIKKYKNELGGPLSDFTDKCKRAAKLKEGLTANEINRLKQTLGQGNDKYYVYMLIVEGEGKPFYIGKGQGDRVFTHEIDAKSIEKGRDDAEADYTKLSDKIKTILDNKGHINKVIIKWGLTSEEAFMCESALINMYDYLCKYPSTIQLSKNDMLSNIVNGHASKKEKSSKSIGEFKTQAWEVKDFLNNVAIQGKYFPRKIQKRCLFININEAMDWWYRKYSNESINRDDYIKDSVRCFWKLRQFTKKDMPEYVIALYQQVVIGVFEVKKCFKLTDKQAFPKYSPYHRMNDWCVYESHKKNGKPNYKLYVKIFKEEFKKNFKEEFKKKYGLDYDTYIKNPKKKKNLYIDNNGQKHVIDTNDMFNQKDYDNILKRTGFELVDTNDKQMRGLVGCLLADSFLKNQNSHYNFDEKGKVNYDKWGIGQVEIEYTPKYNSYTWLGTLHMEIAGNGTFSWKNGFMGRWKLTKQQEKDYCAFFSNPQNLEDFFDDNKAYSTDLDRTNISHPTSYELQITWNGHIKKVSVGVPDIPFKHPFN